MRDERDNKGEGTHLQQRKYQGWLEFFFLAYKVIRMVYVSQEGG